MALSTAVRLKPEIRLAQAISQFEANLSSTHKTEFQRSRAQSLKVPPDTTDVMRFTADVDRRIAKGSRCLGPRFTSFLSSVQQFAALGDVIVGGSQNIIACGVWSVVRMSILVRYHFCTAFFGCQSSLSSCKQLFGISEGIIVDAETVSGLLKYFGGFY